MARKAGGVRVVVEADVTSLQKGMDAANKKISELQGKVKTLSEKGKSDLQRLSAQFNLLFKVGAGYATFAGITTLTNKFKALVELGDQLGDVKGAFEKLGGDPRQIQLASDSIGQLISKTTLYSQANKLLAAGFPETNKNFAKFVEIATKYAEGRELDPTDTLNKMTASLSQFKPKFLNMMGFDITAKDKSTIFTQVMEQIDAVNERLGPIGDGAANAITGIENAWKDLQEELGSKINDDPELTKLLRDFQKRINEIDTDTAARAIINLSNAFLTLAESMMYILTPIQSLSRIGTAWKTTEQVNAEKNKGFSPSYLSGIPLVGPALDLASQSNTVKSLIEVIQGSRGNESASYQEAIRRMVEAGQFDKPDFNPPKATANISQLVTKSLEDHDKLREQLDKDRKAWEDFFNTLESKGLGDIMNNAIKDVDIIAFRQALANLQNQIIAEYESKFGKSLSRGSITQEEYDSGLNKQLDTVTNEWEEKFAESSEKNAQQLKEDLEDGFRDATSFFESSLSDIFSGASVDGKDFLKNALLIGGSNLAASFSKEAGAALKGIGYDFGSAASEMFKGSIGLGRGKNGGIDESLKSVSESFKGAPSIFSAATIGITATLGAVLNASAISKSTKSEAGTGGAIGTGAGAIGGFVIGNAVLPGLGGVIGASMGSQLGNTMGQLVGGLFKRGSSNPDTKARHAFANFIEDYMSKLTSVAFFDAKGSLKVTAGDKFNFLERKGGFNDGAWADRYGAMSKESQTVFTGLGVALKGLAGIADDTFSHIASLLADQFGGSIDNARLLVVQLGLSFDELKAKIEEAALSGEIRWSEYNTAIAGLNDAFAEGLVAVGDLTGAFDEFVQTGGRGRAAVKGLKDIIVEAGEAGITTAAGIEQMLTAQGKNPEQVKAIVAEIEGLMTNNKLKSLKDILGLTDTDLGAAIGRMEAISQSLADEWQKIGNDIDELSAKLENIPKEIKSKVSVEADIDPDLVKLLDSNVVNGGSTQNLATNSEVTTTKYARGGIISRPSILSASLAGESGPEVILPLQSVNGKLGVKTIAPARASEGGVSINIDARGATPGVEGRIRSALAAVENRAVSRAVAAMIDARARGRL